MTSSSHPRRRRRDLAGRHRCRLACEVMERRLLLSTYVVTTPADGTSAGTLRWAIENVDADTHPDTIQFKIPGSGVQTIQLSAPLPAIVNSVTIDGTTQPGYEDSPLIQLDGSQLGADSDGLVISAGNSAVRGLAIVGFSGSAIVLNSLGGNVIAGDYLGVLASGTQAGATVPGFRSAALPATRSAARVPGRRM